MKSNTISLEHGAGGEVMQALIEILFSKTSVIKVQVL